MVTITASFKQNSDAVAAVNALKSAGFVLGPEMPLPIDTEFTVSVERAVSPGAEDSGMTATTGAAIGGILGVIAGLTFTPLVGPAGALAGAGVGAYTGSLVGALAGLDEPKDDAAAESGALLKVSVADLPGKARAVEILRMHDAVNVTE